MIIKNIKKNKGHVPYEAKGFRSGFVLLYAVMLSSIILAITLGVANISLKEINFSTSAKDTNDAFFAADTGAECALYYDKSTTSAFIDPSPPSISCNGNDVALTSNPPYWNFIVSQLGSERKSCAKVTVDKSDPTSTAIISKGYNDGGDAIDSCDQGQNSVERQLEVSY